MDKKKMLLFLAVIYLFTRLVMLTMVPFVQDEGPYSVMIEEQIQHPTLVVTFLGKEVGWKPPLFFWISGIFVQFLRSLPIPIEAVYRLPNVLFGLINVFLIFFIFEKLTGKKDETFAITLAYTLIALPLNVEISVLTDTLCGTFIYAGILSYIYGSTDRKWFLAGGLFTFLAYMTKQTNAALVPALAIALLFQKDRKKLLDPVFLVSLVGFPLAMWLFDASISHISSYTVTGYVIDKVILNHLNIAAILGSLIGVFPFITIWLPASILGFIKNWKINWLVSVWFLLSLFPLIGGTLMPFYFYPVIPAIAYFGSRFFMTEKVILDKFFYCTFIAVLVICLFIGVATQISYKSWYDNEKAAGELLVGKENVLIIGAYYPALFSYKMLEEKRQSGQWLDYGWIFDGYDKDVDSYQKFVNNYWGDYGTGIENENYTYLFASPIPQRKNTSITKFEYIAVALPNVTDMVKINGSLIFDVPKIQIYKLG